MCTINTDLLYKGKYAIRVCNENARQVCRLLSKLFGCKYEDIRRVVSESILFYASYGACIRYDEKTNRFVKGYESWYQNHGYIVIDDLNIFNLEDGKELELSDMDVRVFI